MEEIVNGCEEGAQDERTIQYGDLVGAVGGMPAVCLLPKLPTQDQQKEGWHYGCVYYSNSQGNNILNVIEGSETRSSGKEMCEWAVANNMLDIKSGTYIINGPKAGTKMGYLAGFAQINTIEEVKHSIANNRPVQCGSNKLDWKAANKDNGYTVSPGASYGHAVLIDGYDDNKGQLRVRQSYDRWDSGHQWLNYTDFGCLFPTKFSLIDKADEVLFSYKKQIMAKIGIESAKEAMEAGIWNGLNPKEAATREEVAAMVMRAYSKAVEACK